MECDINQLKSYIVSTLASLSIDTGIQYFEDLATMIKQYPFESCSELMLGLIESYIIIKIRQYLDEMYEKHQNNAVAYVSALINTMNIALLMCTSRECLESISNTVYKIMCECNNMGGKNI